MGPLVGAAIIGGVAQLAGALIGRGSARRCGRHG